MKTIVLTVLIAVAGCGGKKGADCEPAVAKGIESATASLQGRSHDPKMISNMVVAMAKLRTVVTKRCIEDKWSSDVVACFGDAKDLGGLQTCQSKLDKPLRDKLNADVREIRSAPRQHMPDVPGHPPSLSPDPGAPGAAPGSTGAAPASDAPAPAAPAPAAPAPAAPAPSAPAPAAGSPPSTGSAGGW
jgi:small lipoprotein (TIGR04454 family)